MINSLDSRNIRSGLKDYIQLLHDPPFGKCNIEWDKPVSLRSTNDHLHYLQISDYQTDFNEIRKTFQIGNYYLFCIEDIDHLFNFLVQNKVISKDYKFERLNQTENAAQKNKVIDIQTMSRVFSGYPESLLLWKLALKRLW